MWDDILALLSTEIRPKIGPFMRAWLRQIEKGAFLYIFSLCLWKGYDITLAIGDIQPIVLPLSEYQGDIWRWFTFTRDDCGISVEITARPWRRLLKEHSLSMSWGTMT